MPRSDSTRMFKRLSIELTNKQYEKLEEKAREMDLSKNKLVNAALSRYLEDKEKT